LEVNFPDNTAVYNFSKFPAIDDKDIFDEIKRGFENFCKSHGSKKITIVVNDATRDIPNWKILSIIFELLGEIDFQILIAAGTHNAPSENELETIFDGNYEQIKDKVFVHACYDGDNLKYLGKTSRETPVYINKIFAGSDAVICINSVEPHFFAGFTGGRKSLIPGLAGFDTVAANHNLAKSPDARSLNIQNNPINEDLQEAVGLINGIPIYSIQLVLSRQRDIVGLYPGDLSASFQNACEKAKEIYSVGIEKSYDIVFAIGQPPLDINLYQLQKAQEHGGEAVTDGGILVVVGACSEGVGSPYFMKLADEYPKPEMALSETALNDKRFGIHKLIRTARQLRRIKIWYVTKLDDNQIRKVYFEPKIALETALNDALKCFGGNANVAIVMDACFLVPTRLM